MVHEIVRLKICKLSEVIRLDKSYKSFLFNISLNFQLSHYIYPIDNATVMMHLIISTILKFNSSDSPFSSLIQGISKTNPL